MKLVVHFYIVTKFLVTFANNYFVTHEYYSNASLNTTVISWLRIAGDNATVTQQCRRNCAAIHECKACNVKLLQGQASLGLFNCTLFDLNLCDWKNTSLHNVSMSASKLWEKVGQKAQPCVDRCGVKYRGNCVKCGSPVDWSGLDCEIPPQSCSDISSPASVYLGNFVWPWGVNGRNVSVYCMNGTTLMFRTTYSITAELFGLRRLGTKNIIKAAYGSQVIYCVGLIDWPLISAVQSLSKEKKLILEIDLNGVVSVYNFTNVEIGPRGELTMTNAANTNAFPSSLYKASFVVPTSVNTTCGPFWLFTPNAPNNTVCSQRTQLINFGPLIWDGAQTNNTTTASFYFV